jgi:hypothetical protein
MVVRRLSPAEVPNGSVIAVLSDVHIPHHDEAALRLVVECCEDVGVTHVVLNGDTEDCGVGSRHPSKRARDSIDLGTLAASVTPGRWLHDWARTRPCWKIRGNHERWLEDKIAEDPALRAVTPEALLGLPENGAGWEVLPCGSRLRLGSLVIEHGDGIWPSGTGGQNPGQKVRTVAPDQTTIVGHLHRKFFVCWTTRDEEGVPRTRAVYGNGHLSDETKHREYAGTYTGWQQSFALVRVWYDDSQPVRPRFTVDQPEIHRTSGGDPIFEYNGVVYS